MQYLCEPHNQEQAIIKAIHKASQETVRQTSLGLTKLASLRAKLEAIKLLKPKTLRTLLEENQNVSKEIFAKAF